jgi:hypothetical protein
MMDDTHQVQEEKRQKEAEEREMDDENTREELE